MAPRRDLTLRIVASAFPESGKQTRVAATIEVTAPRVELEDRDRKISDHLGYTLLVFDIKNGEAIKRLVNGVEVTSEREMNEAAPPGVRYQMPMSVVIPPGKYQFRAAATSSKLARSGSVFLDVEVQDFTKDAVMLSALALGYAEGPHVKQSHPPGSVPVVPFDVSLDREFKTTDTIRLFFEIAHKNASAPLKATVELIDYTNKVVSTTTPPVQSNGQVDVKLPLSALAAGAYRVRAIATDGKNGATKEVGMIVR